MIIRVTRLCLTVFLLSIPFLINVGIQAQTAATISFSASSYAVEEGEGSVEVTVTRGGNTASAVTVDFATSSGTASDQTDFTPALGTLRFGPGETMTTIEVLITDNFIAEGNEAFDIMLFNATDATLSLPDFAFVTITDQDDAGPSNNPIDETRFFVSQHYHDFLGREPDQAGLDFWTDEIEKCGDDAQCREVKRVNVSAAFYLSIEFKETGYFVRRLYRFYFRHTLWPIWREFMRDVQEVARGLVVGEAGWQERLEENKRRFVEDWYRRHRVVLDSQVGDPNQQLTNEQYVDSLFQKIEITPEANERQALIDGLSNGSETRPSVLRKVADNPVFVQREVRSTFVITEYFGYLRREPDHSGFEFWLAKLDQFDGDFVRAEMVKAFLTSIEYRSRFTQSDALAEAYFEFDVPPRPETLIFKLNDPARIAEARTLIGKNKIVIGRVVKESIYYNRQRRYHLEPDLIGFADFSIELCDTGLQLDDALDHIGGSFLPGNIICPWGSRILREVPPQPR